MKECKIFGISKTYLDRDLVVYELATAAVMKFRLADIHFHNLKIEKFTTTLLQCKLVLSSTSLLLGIKNV